jgi:transposase
MPRDHAYLSRLGEFLGLSDKAVRRKLRWGRLLLLVPAEMGQGLDLPTGDAQMVRAMKDRIDALEQRLDKAETDRRLLIQKADAERMMLLEAIIEANKSKWPGLSPWLKRLWLGETVNSDRSERAHRLPE